MTMIAHTGHPHVAHDLWSPWSGDPAVVVALIAAAALYVRGRNLTRTGQPASDRRMSLALVTIAIALLPPVDRLAGDLASVHMVQHMLLVVVAAPLMGSSAVLRTIARGIPRFIRARAAIAASGIAPPRRRRARVPASAVAGTASAALLWAWHSPVLYEAALRNDIVHALEHATLLSAAVLFWILIARPTRMRPGGEGARILILFAMAMQGVFLALLLTFAPAAWYDPYKASAPTWGWEALADQQLAGVIMWVPAGMIYVGAAVNVLARWLNNIEQSAVLQPHAATHASDSRRPE